jgi:hypothetical protein
LRSRHLLQYITFPRPQSRSTWEIPSTKQRLLGTYTNPDLSGPLFFS